MHTNKHQSIYLSISINICVLCITAVCQKSKPENSIWGAIYTMTRVIQNSAVVCYSDLHAFEIFGHDYFYLKSMAV